MPGHAGRGHSQGSSEDHTETPRGRGPRGPGKGIPGSVGCFGLRKQMPGLGLPRVAPTLDRALPCTLGRCLQLHRALCQREPGPWLWEQDRPWGLDTGRALSNQPGAGSRDHLGPEGRPQGQETGGH